MPLVAYATSLLGALFVGIAADLPAGVPIGLSALALGTVVVLAAREVPRPAPARAALAAVLLGATTGAAIVPGPPAPLAAIDASAATVRGEVVAADGDRSVVEDRSGHRIAVPGVDLAVGTRLSLDAALTSAEAFRNPSPHPSWPRSGAPDLRVTELRTLEIVAPASWLAELVHRTRAALRSALERTLEPETAGVARALVLGDARATSDEVDRAVRGAGLAHVLAVSGMHVTLVVGSLFLFVRRALVHAAWLARRIEVERLAAAIAVPLALGYAELSGGTASAWRASITAAIGFSLRAAGRRPRPVALVAACVVPFAAADPRAAISPAFLLSVAATAAVLDPAPPGTSAVRSAVRTAVRATIATAPIVVWCFGGAPLVGLVANVVLVPFASALLLPVALVHALVAAIAPALAAPTGAVLTTTSRAFVAASDAFASATIGTDLWPLSVAQGLTVAALAGAFLLAPSARGRALAAAVGLSLLAAGEVELRVSEAPRGELRATFLDVGQGDAAILDLPDGRLVLVDAGGAPNGGPDPGARAIVPLLRARRRDRIDLLVVTHPHPDHYGGLAAIARALPIAEVWDTGQAAAEAEDGELARTLRSLAAHGTRIRRPRALCCGARALGDVELEVIWPCPDWDPGWDPNDNSIVMRVRYGARTILLAGDAEAHTERSLRGRVGRIDVLKVAHHGSRTSSDAELLGELRPWLAVVSAGILNRFGHPHAEVWERLTASVPHVVRTDEDGGVVVRTDGHRLRYETWSGRGGER